MRVVCLLYSPFDSAALPSIAESSFQWTPQVAISHEAVFLEISQCRNLYREQTLLLRLRSLNKRFGLKPKIAVASDVPTALATARFQISSRNRLPVEALSDYFLPWDYTDRLNFMIGLLKKLGILNLADFLKLPSRTLSSRFGAEGLLARQRVQERDRILWPRFKPPEAMMEKMVFDEFGELLTNLEPLLFSLKSLIKRIMARLKGKGEKASVIELTIEQEPYSTVKEPRRSWPIRLSMPQGSAAGLLPILKDRLESDLAKKSLEAPVISISLQVMESVPSKAAERDFFSKKEEEEEAWGSLIARLSEKLGREAVFIASPVHRYLPERAWEKTLAYSPDASFPFPLRPLQLFKHPLRMILQGKTIYAGQKRWELIAIQGPERLSGEWWHEPFERDYFKATCRSGEELWIFRTPGVDQYYLHGVFD